MEILETSAEQWWRIAGMLGQVIVKLEPHYDIGVEGAGLIGETLGEIQSEASRLQLRAVIAQLNRINKTIDEAPKQSVLRSIIIDLHQRMCDELNDHFFLSIPAAGVAYYRPAEPLFGAAVEAKFPEMSEDISEAGAVQRFGDKIGVALATDKNWQNILEEINKAIKALDQKSLKTKA